MKKRLILQALADIESAFANNVKAHKRADYVKENWCDSDVSFECKKRDYHYSQKTKFIAKAIKKIKLF